MNYFISQATLEGHMAHFGRFYCIYKNSKAQCVRARIKVLFSVSNCHVVLH